MSTFRNRIAQLKSTTLPDEGIALKQMTLLTNPELVSNEELLQLKSDLSKRRFTKFVVTAGIAALGILYFKANIAGSLSSVFVGFALGNYLSSKIKGKASTICELEAVESYKKHRLNIAHFNYVNISTPIQDQLLSTVDKHYKVQKSHYI